MSVLSHPVKANVVADALSRVTMGSVTHVVDDNKKLVKEVHRLARLDVLLDESPKGVFVVFHNFEPSLVVGVKCKQHLNLLLMELKETILSKFNEFFS